MQLFRKAWYIFQKDVMQEFKTRYAVNAIILFAFVTLVAVSFSIGTYSATIEVKSALLWIILFFSSMSGLAHIFIREEETHTADTLKLVSEANHVFLGKFLFNVLLLFVLEFITVPLFFAAMGFSVQNFWAFLTILMLGSIGLYAGATMIAAIIAKASGRGALFAVLSFPILLPVLVAGISGTKLTALESDFSVISGEVQMLFAYGVVVITASILLFELVWNE